MTEVAGYDPYPECHGLPGTPDELVDDYVEIEQRATGRVDELAEDIDSLGVLVLMARDALQMGKAPDPQLVQAIKELLEKIASFGEVTTGDLSSLVDRRPEVERAVELASGDVHAGWQGRL